MYYILHMEFDWNQEKNRWLEENRGLTFDDVISWIENGNLRAVLSHPKRPRQKIFVIECEGYAYNVPFVEQEDGSCFLKTIYPSRASTKKYLGEKNEKDTVG